MSESLDSVGAIALFVEDPQRSKSFYQDVFDVPAVHEDENAAAFRFENMIVNLLETPAARGMRTASFTDPDGHIWEVAQKLPED